MLINNNKIIQFVTHQVPVSQIPRRVNFIWPNSDAWPSLPVPV